MPSPMVPEVPEPRTPEVAEEVVEDVMTKMTRGLFARSRGVGGQRPMRRNSRRAAEAAALVRWRVPSRKGTRAAKKERGNPGIRPPELVIPCRIHRTP
jgi:hypothetical protein